MENYTVQTVEELALNELNPLKMEICIQHGFLSKFAVRLFLRVIWLFSDGLMHNFRDQIVLFWR